MRYFYASAFRPTTLDTPKKGYQPKCWAVRHAGCLQAQLLLAGEPLGDRANKE
jgi:hypothetical protein